VSGGLTVTNNRDINCCFIGEGEKSIIELFKAFLNGEEWRNIEGLAYVSNDKVIVNKIKEPIIDLDLLPFPKRIKLNNKCKTLALLTSRGCYGDCSFCSEKQFNYLNNTTNMRFRTAKNVVNEIEYLIKTYNPKFISISDSNFLEGSKKRGIWLNEFITLMEERNLKINLRANTRANDIIANKDILIRLKEVGLSSVFIGIESFVQRQLDLYNKKITVEQNIQSIKILKDLDFQIEIGFIILEPFVNLEEVKENIQILKSLEVFDKLDSDQEFFSLACKLFAVNGTRIYDYMDEKGVLYFNELGYKFLNSNVGKYNDLINIWCDYISEFKGYKFLIDKARMLNLPEYEKDMLNWYRDIMKFDIDIMEELISFVNVDKVVADKYLNEKYSILLNINAKYETILDYLKNIKIIEN